MRAPTLAVLSCLLAASLAGTLEAAPGPDPAQPPPLPAAASGTIHVPDGSAAPEVAPGVHAWLWSTPWSDGDGAHVAAWLADQGAHHHHYRNLGMVSFLGTRPTADAVAERFGGRVDANEEMALHLDRTVTYIEADRVKNALPSNLRGGPTVLVVDTGIDSSHPDFQAGINLAANVQADRTGGLITGVLDQLPVVDLAGHGTHVAGIVAGLGESLGPQDSLHGRYVGVYSSGRIVGFQASTDAGTGRDIRVDTLAALEAFDWAIQNRHQYDIRVVTNSWGTAGGLEPDHPITQATLRLYLNGMTVVFSAGNEGEKGAGTLNKYCLAPWVLCVAAGDLNGARASFSSYGRTPNEARPWDHPDLTAPGFFVHSAEPPATVSGSGAIGSLLEGQVSSNLYRERSGTSMAAPHVAATAALLMAANARLSPDQVMDILAATTDPMADPVERVGTGYLNARAAYNLAIQTVGNRDAFLAGHEVKYAGPLSGDPQYANDPVSVGYDAEMRPGSLLAPRSMSPWIVSDWLVAVPLILAAFLAVVSGLQLRPRRPPTDPPSNGGDGDAAAAAPGTATPDTRPPE